MFEITTAAALLLFARHPADVLVLEVGLGGRLDATNVIERPLASVITPVSIDHTEFLGDTLDADRRRRRPASSSAACRSIVAAQHREALAVIERQAARLKAPLRIAGEDWTATEERGRLVYQDDNGLLDLPAPKLYGRHQFENAGLAIATLRALPDLKLPPAAFEAGMVKADWPARMQRLTHGRLAELAPRRQRAVARRRAQSRRRPRHRRRARRSGGARVAAAGADRRHADDQGQCAASCAISPGWRAG